MKRKTELLILVLIYGLWGYLSISSDSRTLLGILFTLALFISSGLLFFGNVYFLFGTLQKDAAKKSLRWNATLLCITYLLSAGLFAAYFATIGQYELLLSHLFHPTVVTFILPNLLVPVLLGITYAYLRQVVLLKRYRLLKKISFYTAAVLVSAGLTFFTKHQLDVSYQGDEDIRFIEAKYASLEEIIRLPQFQGKVVYVDLWYSTCGPCLEQFKHTATLKKHLQGKDVAFLYMGRETSHPNSRQRWKNAIRENNLQGWHFYMSKPMADQLWEHILANQKEQVAAAYPRYLLFDKNGELVTYNAKRPSEGELTIRQIERLHLQPLVQLE